ncbi:MAG: radical SAM protein [Candidatus Riflebacteria bacterium]|nr:radical SAM protein [Candidatus Riflebacteria bacterium]
MLQKQKAHGPQSILEALSNLDNARNRGLFMPFPGPTLQVPLSERPGLRPHGLQGLILEVTERCCLRCSYCLHSGDYLDERVHSGKQMSFEVASRAIEFFLDGAREDCYIDFYGGEPLLRKRFLEDCMRLASRLRPGCAFAISTNGYLLGPRFDSLLRTYRPKLCVSLDGPRTVHDRFRVLPSGEGSFARIIANLERLAKLDGEYFRSRVRLNVLVAASGEIEKTIRFFRRSRLLRDIPVAVLNVGLAGMNEETRLRWSARMSAAHLTAARDRYLLGLSRGDLSGLGFEHSLFGGGLKVLLNRDRSPIGDAYCNARLCVVGALRLHVGATGTFRPCAKTARLPVIGHADSGYDLDAIRRIREEWLSTCDPCKRCWALRLCRVCYKDIYSGDGGSRVDPDEKFEACERHRSGMSSALTLYMEALEGDSTVFSRLEDRFRF